MTYRMAKSSVFVLALAAVLGVLIGCGDEGSATNSETDDVQETESTQLASDSSEAETDTSSDSSEGNENEAKADVGKVHEVKMIGDENGFYYDPDKLTIEKGDMVRWVHVSGAPHNVSFKDQELPDGAKKILKNNEKFESDYYHVPGQKFELHFSDEYPTGDYNYVCVPHEASGMTGVVTVESAD